VPLSRTAGEKIYRKRGNDQGKFDPKTEEQLEATQQDEKGKALRAMVKKQSEFILLKFRKDEDRPSGAIDMEGLNLAEAQKLTGQGKDNPLYDSYPIPEKFIKELQIYATEKLDPKRFDYFLERPGSNQK